MMFHMKNSVKQLQLEQGNQWKKESMNCSQAHCGIPD